jgi:predicted transposase/invertase (TIGR01784 family)
MLKEKVKLFLDDELEEAERRGEAEGKVEGKAEGKAEVALKLKELGVSQEDIMKATGLGLGDVRKIVSGGIS